MIEITPSVFGYKPSSQFNIYSFKVIFFRAASSPWCSPSTSSPGTQYSCISWYASQSLHWLHHYWLWYKGCSYRLLQYKEAWAIMSNGMFNLRSWSSNCSKLQASAVQDNTANDYITIYVLGYLWDPTTDLLSLVAKPFLLPTNHLVAKDKYYKPHQGFSILWDFYTEIVATQGWMGQTLSNKLA